LREREEHQETMLAELFRVRGADAGQTLAEYALILSLIAVVAIAALILLGTDIGNILSSVGAKL
jgi:Flp pilus assembly pilin Flp